MKKKRSNGEGSFTKMPSGNWRGQIMLGYDEDGKKIVKSFSAATKTEVQQKIRDYLFQREKEEEEKQTISFSEWAGQWYADYRTEVQESTYASYRFTMKILSDYFGDRPISSIRQKDINAFVDVLLEKDLSRSTIGKCRSMLYQIFSAAEDNDLIDKNPAVRAKSVKHAKRSIVEKDAFTPEEINILKRELPDNLMGNSILTLIGTGLRLQELLALTKADIAEDGSRITVNKAVKIVDRIPSIGTTKSIKGNRIIPVSARYRRYVQSIRDHGGSRFIWTSSLRESGIFTIEEFRNRYRTVLKKVTGVRPLTPHCCRHTYITNLQAEGMPMEYIRLLAGHEDMTTTLGYTHTSIETLTAAIEKLDSTAKNDAEKGDDAK